MRRRVRLQVAAAAVLFLSGLSYFLYSVHAVWQSPQSADASAVTVLIDPGHGGVDGGAVAPDGTAEKDLNLQIALLLREQLSAFGIRTEMTRTTDASIHDQSAETVREKKVSDIHNRMQLMEETENCLFVSIHQNKFSDPSLSGTQVFYAPKVTQSAALADSIQSSVRTLLQPENDRQIKPSDNSIYLLFYAQKPAVLVECGFLSNAGELQSLQQAAYRQKLAFCIAAGILSYLHTQQGR